MDKYKYILITALSGALLLSSGMVMAAEEQVYGNQLMTSQERAEHRNRMQAANSQEERNRIRQEHHKRMQIRAKERGVSLPDEMPARGKGMGNGMGPRDGSGMGNGGGKNR